MARPVLLAPGMKRRAAALAPVSPHRPHLAHRPRLAHLARLGVVGGAALALLASTEAGERNQDGSCPAGETCAPETPEGLLFEGAPLGTWPALTAHTIAAGGRQTFRIIYPEGGPFDLPFVAKVSSSGHRIVASGEDRAVVGADREATGYLRILDDAGQLYDRLAIASAPIAAIAAAPSYGAAYPLLEPTRWAAFAGGEATVALRLTDRGGRRLVDEDLALRSPVPAARTGWDSFTLTTGPAGVIALSVEAGGGAAREVRVPVVDVVDEVEAPARRQTGVGGDLEVCFTAWLRGDRADSSDDTLLIGVPRTYRISGPATPLATQAYGSCLQLHTDADGTVVVDATIAGRTYTATIDVRGASPRDASGFAVWLRAPSEGERAASR